MSLKSLSLDIEYSSESSDLLNGFYRPCFNESNLYCRAVGYFTSQGLKLVTPGMESFLHREGRILLIASPILSEEDIDAINSGYLEREQVLSNVFYQTIEGKDKDHLNLLSWLISMGVMDIKLALKVDGEGRLARGQFHEKFGFFTDSYGYQVAFSGSANETVGGLIDNQESIDVYWSWDDPHGRVERKVTRFNALWKGQAKKLLVVDFTEATERLLRPYKTSDIPVVREEPAKYGGVKEGFYVPGDIELRGYQKEAINNWLKANGRGVMRMATGTGKTITGLSVAATLAEKVKLKWLVVVCPYKHLAIQWRDECVNFGGRPLLAFEAVSQWLPALEEALVYGDKNNDALNIVIVTTATFSGKPFQNKLKYFPTRTLLIADEVHNMGAKKIRRLLPEQINLRLGLSATPERWLDDDGTQAIFDYFGDVLDPQLGLKEALELEVLTPYYYHPILIELTDDEYDIYLDLSEKLAKLMAMGESLEDDVGPLQSLLIKRARLLASASNKLLALKSLAQGLKNDTHMLFYCGDGRVDQNSDEEDIKQIEAVCQLLGRDEGMIVSRYTAETDLNERERLKQQLANGDIQGLVAIRCLDEGVDIPSIKTAVILASSTNPRQFIQRRGRILRKSPGKEAATIYDMLVVPPPDVDVTDTDRALVRKELARFVEFSDLAKNSGEARKALLNVQKRYDLMDM